MVLDQAWTYTGLIYILYRRNPIIILLSKTDESKNTQATSSGPYYARSSASEIFANLPKFNRVTVGVIVSSPPLTARGESGLRLNDSSFQILLQPVDS